MPILAGDIKLVASRIMDDVPEGGGAPTATVILDGASNAIFPDISELDRAGGRVNLRKLHISVQTADTDSYLGSNIIVAEPPTDPNVSVTLFSTKETFDRRTDAKSRIESYLTRGPAWPGFLFENHVAGQRSIQLFQRPETETPPIGHTLVVIGNEGLSSELAQYVRVTRVSSVIRTFMHDDGTEYKAAVVTCEISDALRYSFVGSPPSKFFRKHALAAITRDSTVADAGVYVGVVPLTAPVAIGDLSAKAASIFTQLVPSAQTEIAMTDLSPNGALAIYTPAGAPYTFTTSVALSQASSLALAQNLMPGTLSIAVGGTTLTDNGGKLMAGITQVGLVDYEQGVVSISAAEYSYPGAKTVTYTPAGVPTRSLSTASWVITQETRATTLVTILDPPPTPTSLSLSYRAQGRWYTLRDNGAGQLLGSDAAFGTGTVSYLTGSVAVTLGALPDVGSNVLATYGLPSTDQRRDGGAVKVQNVMQLAHGAVAPGTVTVGWILNTLVGGVNTPVAKTATDNGQGLLTGDGTGTVNYIDGIVTLYPTLLPTPGVEFSVQYGWGAPLVESFVAPERNPDGTITLPLLNPNVMPRTVRVEWNTVYDPADLDTVESVSQTSEYQREVTSTRPWQPSIDPIVTALDNGLGTFSTRPECAAVIDYAAGTLTFHPNTLISIPTPKWGKVLTGTSSYKTGSFERFDVGAQVINTITTTRVIKTLTTRFTGFTHKVIGAIMPTDLSALVKVSYRTTAAGTTTTETFGFSPSVDLTVGNRDPIIPGSVSFTLGTNRYVDRQGKLYTNIDHTTGAGQQVGTINYSLGVCVLTLLSEGESNAGSVGGMVTTQALLPVTEVKFRTSAAPIRPGGFVVQFVMATDGVQTVRTLTADTDGKLSAADVKGEIDYETGVVSLRFGQAVTAAGNESAVWYDADYVAGDGKIWRPAAVVADTIRYAASAYTYLPLDAEILGLDPVRLPQDGRVPIFRTGGFAVIGNTQAKTLTATNDMVVNCNRVRLSRVRIVGADGLVINTGYSADLEAGTVTFTDVSAYAQPVKIENRIEDMLQLSDVQINGQLGFTRSITHTYPVTGSHVSSALVAQDLKARVSVFFDQGTWDGITWSDGLVGNSATATFNDILAPLVVTNAGAVTERWALRFTNSSTFDIVGEHVGVVGTGSINTVTAPINPATNSPYFTIPVLGWGIGWAVGNVLRLNTVGAMFPVWVVRTIQQGAESVQDDSFTLLVRGDVDRP